MLLLNKKNNISQNMSEISSQLNNEDVKPYHQSQLKLLKLNNKSRKDTGEIHKQDIPENVKCNYCNYRSDQNSDRKRQKCRCKNCINGTKKSSKNTYDIEERESSPSKDSANESQSNCKKKNICTSKNHNCCKINRIKNDKECSAKPVD